MHVPSSLQVAHLESHFEQVLVVLSNLNPSMQALHSVAARGLVPDWQVLQFAVVHFLQTLSVSLEFVWFLTRAVMGGQLVQSPSDPLL